MDNNGGVSQNYLNDLLRRQDQQQAPNMLTRLRGMFSPTSTAGVLGNQDAYRAHVMQAVESGEQPMSREQFLQHMQMQQQQPY